MKRTRTSKRASDPIQANVAELSRMNLSLLSKLTLKLAASEQAQQRFRHLVVAELTRIDTIVNMIHGAQIVEAQGFKPGYEKRMEENAKAAEEFIERRCMERGLTIMRYIYSPPSEPVERHDRRRKWSGWEI